MVAAVADLVAAVALHGGLGRDCGACGAHLVPAMAHMVAVVATWSRVWRAMADSRGVWCAYGGDLVALVLHLVRTWFDYGAP